MPLYEFLCDDCDTRFELRRPMERSVEETNCPRCEAPARRAFSVFAAFTTSREGEVASATAGMTGCGACACGH